MKKWRRIIENKINIEEENIINEEILMKKNEENSNNENNGNDEKWRKWNEMKKMKNYY